MFPPDATVCEISNATDEFSNRHFITRNEANLARNENDVVKI